MNTPLSRRRSSIPLFRRRANVLVKFLLLFIGIPITVYLFVTSRATKLRKQALLTAFIEDPAWTGRWPDAIRIPVHQRSTEDVSRRLQGRSNEVDVEQKLVDWKHWTLVQGWNGETGTLPHRQALLLHSSNLFRSSSGSLRTDYHDYLERMNTHTYEIVDAAIRHPDISRLDVWGPKWRYWDPTVALSENLRRRMWWLDELEMRKSRWQESRMRDPLMVDLVDSEDVIQLRAEEFMSREEMDAWWNIAKENRTQSCPSKGLDLVWTISDIFKQSDPMLDVLPCGALLAQQLGDCHHLNCLKEWYPNVSNITVIKYAFEMLELFNEDRLAHMYPGLDRQLFGHSPDSANPWDFWPVEWSKRTSNVKMFGFTGSCKDDWIDEILYPIRVTITDHLQSSPEGSSSLIERYQHPGYTVWEDQWAYDDPMITYEQGNAAYQHHEALREDFASHMRQAKICVFDASIEKKMIRKWAQALLSGCVVVRVVFRFPVGHGTNMVIHRRAIFRRKTKISCLNL
ncbi:hypothetical protein QFC19_002818 [Naganishia cerealis]|uniref:Uncharacterized protein n=1 Tax=Naganishia cerealis TaxID=610337 RepID=A0ACC2W6R3_9TREE|nr:hypothetical protein QFC19_002818 [Naganishia cerealis]